MDSFFVSAAAGMTSFFFNGQSFRYCDDFQVNKTECVAESNFWSMTEKNPGLNIAVSKKLSIGFATLAVVLL